MQHLADIIMSPPSRLLLIYLFRKKIIFFFVAHIIFILLFQNIFIFLSSLQRELQKLIPYIYINIKLTG